VITLFTTPKPFRGHIATIQRNAIRSWTLLRPRLQIVVFGQEEGTSEVVRDFGLTHVPEVERNEYGTPLISDLFARAQQLARHETLCYVNFDIMLMSDIVAAAQAVRFPQFVLSGQRWNVDLDRDWDFSPGWEARLRAYVGEFGQLFTPSGMDYFIFPKDLEVDFPPFAVGRIGWDNWFLFHARQRRIPVVDATKGVMAVHQNHDHAHVPSGRPGVDSDEETWALGPEGRRNFEVAGWQKMLDGDKRQLYTLRDATWRMSPSGQIRPWFPLRGLLYRYMKRYLE
jgi:hypothetical protein